MQKKFNLNAEDKKIESRKSTIELVLNKFNLPKRFRRQDTNMIEDIMN